MIWFALIAGPLAWAVRELVSYALVTPSCLGGTTRWLFLTAAAMFALTLSGALVARVCLIRLGRGSDSGGAAADRALFMATVAVTLDLLVALLIGLSVISELALSPCE